MSGPPGLARVLLTAAPGETMSDPSERRYSEREFALILRKASDLYDQDRVRSATSSGMSLSEIQQIADEAGIDPQLITRAAALIGHGDISEEDRKLFGPSGTLHLSSSVEGMLSEDDMRRLMEVVRFEIAKTGTISEELGSVIWKADNAESPFEVRVTPREGRSAIEILSGTQSYKALIYLMSGVTGFMGTLIPLALLDVPKPVLLLSAFLAAPALSTLISRPIWTAWSKRWRLRLTDLLDTLRQEAEARLLPARAESSARIEPGTLESGPPRAQPQPDPGGPEGTVP